MELKDEILLYIDKATKQGRTYIEDEFTRNRITKMPNGSTYQMTLLEKLNGVKWLQQDPDSERVQVNLPEMFGEIEHPDTMMVTLKNVSHSIKNIRLQDNLLIGDIVVLDTWRGTELANLLETKRDSIVFRPRHMGTVNYKNQITKLDIITFDAIMKSDDLF